MLKFRLLHTFIPNEYEAGRVVEGIPVCGSSNDRPTFNDVAVLVYDRNKSVWWSIPLGMLAPA